MSTNPSPPNSGFRRNRLDVPSLPEGCERLALELLTAATGEHEASARDVLGRHREKLDHEQARLVLEKQRFTQGEFPHSDYYLNHLDSAIEAIRRERAKVTAMLHRLNGPKGGAR